MTNLLLTGIPKVGKSALIKRATEDAKVYLEHDIRSLSLGDLFGEEAKRLWRTEPDRRLYMDYTHQQALRSQVISEASRLLLHGRLNETNPAQGGYFDKGTSTRPVLHNIIDTPMTFYLQGSVPNVAFSHQDIAKLDAACGGLDLIVTLLDDSELLSKKFTGDFAKNEDQILQWLSYEADVSEKVTPSHSRTLVMAKENSNKTLLKLLMDPQAPAGYSAIPITKLKDEEGDTSKEKDRKREALEQIKQFRNEFFEYSALLTPMTMPDARAKLRTEVIATEYRDKHFFIRASDFAIAFYPDVKYGSRGIPDELKHTINTGGFVILIHPDREKYEEGAFGVRANLYYETKEHLYDAILKSRNPVFDGAPEAYLRRFLLPDQDLPRYAMLSRPVVAVDFVNENDEHLLIRQPAGKQFGGYWTLVAGKKEGTETDLEACMREAEQEVGLKVTGLENEDKPWLAPTDYADGSDVKYVRFYQCSPDRFAGRVSPNHITEHPEVDGAKWATRDQILRMRQPIMPATKAYFQQLKE